MLVRNGVGSNRRSCLNMRVESHAAVMGAHAAAMRVHAAMRIEQEAIEL